jgi:hypothetical protein
MTFVTDLLNGNKEPEEAFSNFWAWFRENETVFFNAIKNASDIEATFFNKLSAKLAELRAGIAFLAGMHNDSTVELVLTSDGIVENFAFTEDIIRAAPAIPGWKFTALKQAMDINDLQIEMEGYVFNSDNLFFYSNDFPIYPDVIDITVVYSDYKEEDEDLIRNGVYVFIDSYLGELVFATTIDNLSVANGSEIEKELVPIDKLQAYLTWRQKEFLEKYEGERHDTEHDSYVSLEGVMEEGMPVTGIINTTLLDWDRKPSHPWIAELQIRYDGDKETGMPTVETYQLLDEIENEAISQLKDADGYLCIGRHTGDNTRVIYFGCKEFRKPSKVLHQLTIKYSQELGISSEIRKDKYWQSFEQFREAL